MAKIFQNEIFLAVVLTAALVAFLFHSEIWLVISSPVDGWAEALSQVAEKLKGLPQNVKEAFEQVFNW